MALVDCEECGAPVSDTAAACPKCGAPLNSSLTALHPPVDVNALQAVRRYKRLQIVGAVLMCVGVVACAAHELPLSASTFMPGLLIFLGARIAARRKRGQGLPPSA